MGVSIVFGFLKPFVYVQYPQKNKKRLGNIKKLFFPAPPRGPSLSVFMRATEWTNFSCLWGAEASYLH
jgi:hypothetical protein